MGEEIIRNAVSSSCLTGTQRGQGHIKFPPGERLSDVRDTWVGDRNGDNTMEVHWRMKRRGKADSQVVMMSQGLRLLGVIQRGPGIVYQGDGVACLLALLRVQEVPRSLGGGREGERGAVGIPCTPLGFEDGLGAEGIKAAIGGAIPVKWLMPTDLVWD